MTIPADPNILDRILTPLRALIRKEMQRVQLAGKWEYVVVQVRGSLPNGITVDAQPTDTSIGLPSVSNLAIRSAVGAPMPSIGAYIHLTFLNQDRTRPVFEGGSPQIQAVSLDASGMLPVARVTDTTEIPISNFTMLPATITITGTGPPVPVTAPGGPYACTITMTVPIEGNITSGNEKVLA